MQAQYAGNRRFGMHVQLFSHMHGVEVSGAVGLFVRTKVIIPNFICHNGFILLALSPAVKLFKHKHTAAVECTHIEKNVLKKTSFS